MRTPVDHTNTNLVNTIYRLNPQSQLLIMDLPVAKVYSLTILYS